LRRERRAAGRAPGLAAPVGAAAEGARASPGRSSALSPSYLSGPAYGLGEEARQSASSREPTRADAETAWRAISSSDNGRPIDAALRRRIEGSLGRDFSHVRVHTGASARAASRALGARAFTHRHHIFLGRHESLKDGRLLAHELTHVAQQGEAGESARPTEESTPHAGFSRRVPLFGAHLGPAAGSFSAGGIASPGRAPATHIGPGRGVGGRGAAARSGGGRGVGRGATVQRWDLWGAARRAGGAIVSGARAVGGAVAEAAGDLLEMGRDALLAVVRLVAPGFLDLFQGDGIAGFVRRLVGRGFRSLFGGAVARLRSVFRIPGLARFARAAEWLGSVAFQLARNDCSGILQAARQVGRFFGSVFSPVVERVRGLSRTISGFFRGLLGALGSAILPFLRRIGGALWRSLRSFVSTAATLIRRVKSALGSAWTRVKGWLGIRAEEGESEGGGLWNWIGDKAAEVWEAVKGPLRPAMGPLRVVGGVLLMLTPAGPILAVIQAWPHLRQAFTWIRSRWREANLVVRARRFLAETVIPTLSSAAHSLGRALERGAAWMLGLLGRIAEGVSRATSGLGGGLLAPLARAVAFVGRGFARLLAWARSGLRSAAARARGLFRRLVEFLRPVWQVLRRLIAIAVNPFGIPGLIAGTLWQLIPNCLKGPVIDFIVGILIRLLRAMPPLPQLGLLWPFVKAGLLGFLERVRSFAVARKVRVSNKLANIVAGGSAGFAFGFLRGLALGVWEAVIGPFQALVDLFRLPGLIRQFLQGLGLRFEDVLGEVRR
ncbi:MAG: DUF4157 domain-containing protein, partial [Holophagales bacterium]|nr:DUF4157 domain-containing protein [Holophagales bacterium]